MPRDGYVAVDTNRYPVPLEWAGRRLEVRILVDKIELHAAGEEPIRHARLEGKHQVARWRGAARTVPWAPPPPEGRPQWDPAYLSVAGEPRHAL